MNKHVKPLKRLFLGLVVLLASASSMLYAQNVSKSSLQIKENSFNKLSLVSSILAQDFKQLKINTPLGVFSELHLPDYGSTLVPGSPKLPVLKKIIEVPVGATVKINIMNHVVHEVSLSSFGLANKIIPAQPSLSKSDNPSDHIFIYDSLIYNTDSYTGQELVKVIPIGTMRGINLARIEIAPVLYNPVQNKILYYSEINFEIVFENPDVAASIQNKEIFYSPFFETSLSMVINHQTMQNKANLTSYPVKYVIVSDPMFQATLQPFVQWKTKKGFTVVEAYTNDPLVGTTTTSIKAYLQNLYNAATPGNPAPSFVLFVGDIAQVPSFAGTTGTHVTDLPYCEYTSDFLPEVYYGRFSATSNAELQPQIDKTLEYEQFMMPKPSFLDTCVMIAGQDPNNGPTFGDGQINYGTDTYFNAAHNLFSHTYLFAVSASSAAQIIQDVSRGVCFANYTAHGGSNGWSDPSFSVNDISTLNNAHKYPLMIGNACLTNKFDEPACFGEALLRADMKGALGYIGGSNSTYWDEDYWWEVGYRNYSGTPPLHTPYDATKPGAYDLTFHDHGETFADWFVTQGQMLSSGNLAVTQSGSTSFDYYWEIYHLMGDPSLMVYYSNPPAMTVSYNSLMPLGATSFTVTTNAPYAYVAISANGVLHGASLADSTGTAIVDLDPITVPGTADIVVTRQNRQPFISTIVVASPTGPYVLYQSNHVNPSSGNNDTLVDFNENVVLDVALKNYGAATAQGVAATLSSSDPFITITGSVHNWGNINSNTIATETSAFTFTTHQHVPDQHLINFNLAMTDNSSNSWNSQFTMIINAPELGIGTFTIDDASGNNNGAIDPGENVQIVIENFNTGHSNAPNTTGTLTSTSQYVTITNSTYNFNTLNKGGNANSGFSVAVSSSLPDTAIIVFHYTLQSGQYIKQNTYMLSAGVAMEDFETGTFTKFDWIQSGNAPWTITNIDPYEGVYSAKSGLITNDQTSELQISMQVSLPDTISFWKKVSCEKGSNWGGTYYWYDHLEFLIDGVSMGRWDGIDVSWSKAEYPVGTGTHTFSWVYKKDGSVSEGDDCAWLDFIVFPPSIKIIQGMENASSETPVVFTCAPNPTSGLSRINFNLNKSSKASLTLHDMTGKLMAKIIDQEIKNEGDHVVFVNFSRYSPGIYFLNLSYDNIIKTEKIIIIK